MPTSPAPRGRAAKHNPGGKVRSSLPRHIRHKAVFSFCGRYRPLLRRWDTQFNERFPMERYVVFIGMNPSMADNDVSDSTVTRAWNIAISLGYNAMVQLNVADIRGTHPAALPTFNVPIASSMNIPFIKKLALGADMVIACWGELTGSLATQARQVFKLLQAELGVNKPIYCFGVTKNGWPRHFRGLPAKTTHVPLRTHP